MITPMKTPEIHLADHSLCVGPAGDLPHTWGVDHAGSATLIKLGPARISIDTSPTPPDIKELNRAAKTAKNSKR